MKFLVDANLPKLLAVRMRELGYDSFHVKEVGLQESKDTEIWSHAFENGQAIITKDEDFSDRITVKPEGPSIVLVKRDNCKKKYFRCMV